MGGKLASARDELHWNYLLTIVDTIQQDISVNKQIIKQKFK
jgi:hypothetical protein